jgi:CxxC motif-containing protein
MLRASINEDKSIASVTGNTCPRGEKYARDELTNPVRTLTSTVKLIGGKTLPVRTNKPIPKKKLFDAMKIIKSASATVPVSVGDVILRDFLGDGTDLIATRTVTEDAGMRGMRGLRRF